ncbi:thiamine pyrophosphate-dependent dehydrogenase E1 component subunit alpha [Conexibacter sp. CPCC 206217]|uniref:thiamine pyrophosphate-dependent dehydrogenase E1 component subunit alpha n=1 Tax=Conexibacter sp. CPCC 206217 TaxID=3064574 RepID=UPI00272304DB|nr:thiamine pyrophosphate-dependent dehydrogenase E1 component subunit alpha [Conexibacter sp. CPCC 206217]MDO8212600.1 thiamine pyrophosphate-dependent dehydrogenase E1 component subunit alpha [Conexibacter sp. CPCC 206217]
MTAQEETVAGAGTGSAVGSARLSDDQAISTYRLMSTSRELEVQLARTYADGGLPGWIHSCEGHEALAGAVALALREDDHLVPHYRSRPEQLGKGMSVRAIVAEVFGTVDAASRGRGGETHVSSVAHRIYGMTGVLGSNIPLGAGVAYASKMRGVDEVTLVSFGDGTANRGAFHEALNLAAIWRLPVVFLCDNNQYVELSRISDFIGVENIADRAAGYGMPGEVVDGHDPEALTDALTRAVALARGGQPSLVEAKMIRRRGHWEGDPQDYRPDDEPALLAATDPVPAYRRRLSAQRGVTDDVLAAIDASAREVVSDALTWAASRPLPTAEDVLGGVYHEEAGDA